MSSGTYEAVPVARELAAVVVADYMHEEFFGELRLQSGIDYGQYSELTMESFGDESAHYRGLTVMPCHSTLNAEDATRLNVPTDRRLWLARAVVADIPSRLMGRAGGAMPRSNHIRSGYFYETEPGAWNTDTRDIADPTLLGNMARERGTRTRLIENIRQVGARTVQGCVENLEDMFVRVTSATGVTHEAILDASKIVGILHRYREGRRLSPGVVGYPLPDVLEALIMEDHSRG